MLGLILAARSQRRRRFSFAPCLNGIADGGALESRYLMYPKFVRINPFSTLFQTVSTAAVPVPWDGGPHTWFLPPLISSDNLGVHHQSWASSVYTPWPGTGPGVNQYASAVIDHIGVVPWEPGSTSDPELLGPRATWVGVDHAHLEQGDAMDWNGGTIWVDSHATGVDQWDITEHVGAEINVTLNVNVLMDSEWSWTGYNINFQSTFLNFSLVGTSNAGVLTVTDRSNSLIHSDPGFAPNGQGNYNLSFNTSATPSMGVNYSSFVYTEFGGPGDSDVTGTPPSDIQFLSWSVHFAANP